jgi:tetratricopeptide (TPR) repeat protein
MNYPLIFGCTATAVLIFFADPTVARSAKAFQPSTPSKIAITPAEANSANPYVERGNEKLDRDPQGAVAEYSQAIAINPKLAQAYYNRGMAKREKLNDKPGAIKDLKVAARLFREQGLETSRQLTIYQLRRLGATE